MTIIAGATENRKPRIGHSERATRPDRPAGYWERIDRIVSKAPPLTDAQRARIRVIAHQTASRGEAA
ncbi:hypothetical protein ACFUJU_28910 [Streptomyces sp. NPDC057235]|uniref:hypothetical protein n=1 Tax=Streptomyces sp. NPDC057235 TaxID=3346058 RepID=UPI00363AFAB6